MTIQVRECFTQQKKYSVRADAMKTIEATAPIFGSQGRAIQVAAGVLRERKKRFKLKHHAEENDQEMEPLNVRLPPSTIRIIDRFTPMFGKDGVMVALADICAELAEEDKKNR